MKKSRYKLHYRLDLGHLATFVPNKKLPIYRWYYYKEGYSRDLVFLVAEMFGLKKGDYVLDPFCGVGTTLLACKEKGIRATGFDVSKIAAFAAKVKTRDYDAKKIREEVRNIFKIGFLRPEIKIDSGVVKRSFSKYALESIIYFRDNILKIKDEKIRDFLLLGLMASAMDVSIAKKTGRSIRSEKGKSIPPLKFLLKRRLMRMIKDIEKTGLKKLKTDIFVSSACSLNIKDESVDAVITSPPYLGKTEYSKIYSIEEVLFFGECGRPEVTGFIGAAKTEEDVFCGKYCLPDDAISYFKDMHLAISEMHRVLKKGGKAAIIVGEGCFPEGVVESDILLSEIAENTGFKINDVIVLNERWCMKNRTIKIGKMRESMIILEK